MKIAISTESTLDIPKELQKEFDIDVIPFTVILGDKSGYDGEITPEEIFDYVDKNRHSAKNCCGQRIPIR